MLPHLTLAQRLIAGGAALAVGLFLYLQVDENGLSDSPWLISTLAVAVLLTLAIRSNVGSASLRSDDANVVTPKGGQPKPSVDRPIGLELVFTSARNNMDKFYNNVSVGSSSVSAGNLRAWRPMLIRKAAFMLTFMLFAKKVPNFATTALANALRDISIGGLTDASEMAMLSASGPLSIDRPSLLKHAVEITLECERAIYETMARLAADERNSFDPMYSLMDREAGLPERPPENRENFYGPNLRTWFRLLDARDVEIDASQTEEPYQNYEVEAPPRKEFGQTTNQVRRPDGFRNWLTSLEGYEEPAEEFSITLSSSAAILIGATIHNAAPSTIKAMRWDDKIKSRIVQSFVSSLKPEDASRKIESRPVPIRMATLDWPRLLKLLASTKASDPREEGELLGATGDIRNALIDRGLMKDDPEGVMTVEMPLRALLAVAAALIKRSPADLGLTAAAHRRLVSAFGSDITEKWGKTPIDGVPLNEPAEVRALSDDWREVETFVERADHSGLLATYGSAIGSLIRVERRLRTASRASKA